MIRRFLKDVRGNYMLLTAAAMVPIMGGLALAVDYTEMAKQRQETLNALDAAGIATARRIVEGGATEVQIKAYAKDFFEANLASVKPTNTVLTIVLPTQNTGGGTLKLSADLKYAPIFYPTFAKLVGRSVGDAGKLDFKATSEVRLKNTLEVALVLDNSGSMDYVGSGSGKKRMVLLKDAAKELVDTIASQAKSMQQLSKPVQFGVVPFAASVNVGPANKTKTWMDLDGISPIHHENFDWANTMNSGTMKVQNVGGVWYKKGTGWGAAENQKVTRFSMYDDVTYQNTQTYVAQYTCTAYKSDGKTCKTWASGYTYTTAPMAQWEGCVEARPYPYNNNDATPSTATPATLFVPMYGPDETDLKDSSNRAANNNWLPDVLTGTGNSTARQNYMPKYFSPVAYGASATAAHAGPNSSCTTTAITPLTDVSTTAGVTTVKNAIDAMASNGATNVPEGMAWGWRVVSSGEPFTQGRPETERGNDKVVIVLTDGENTYYTPSSLGYNDLSPNKSIYSAYGYTGKAYNSGNTRLFLNTSTSVGKTDYSNANYTKALNEQFAALCTNAKDKGIIVMTVSLDLSTSDTTENAQINALKSCSSESRFRKATDGKPAKLYWNATGGSLATTFKEIADELSNLRIVG